MHNFFEEPITDTRRSCPNCGHKTRKLWGITWHASPESDLDVSADCHVNGCKCSRPDEFIKERGVVDGTQTETARVPDGKRKANKPALGLDRQEHGRIRRSAQVLRGRDGKFKAVSKKPERSVKYAKPKLGVSRRRVRAKEQKGKKATKVKKK